MPPTRYSQFLYCAQVLKMKDPRFPKVLEEWARHFPNETSYRCYNPEDMQFRFVVGRGGAREKFGVNAGATDAKARRVLQEDFAFVGIVELFEESLCLLRWKTEEKRPPEYCACGGGEKGHSKFPKVQHIHKVPKYNSSYLALTERERAAIRPLVAKHDVMLYLHGLSLFEERAKAVFEATGVQILCPEKLAPLWTQALRDACALRPSRAPLINATYGRACTP